MRILEHWLCGLHFFVMWYHGSSVCVGGTVSFLSTGKEGTLTVMSCKVETVVTNLVCIQ